MYFSHHSMKGLCTKYFLAGGDPRNASVSMAEYTSARAASAKCESRQTLTAASRCSSHTEMVFRGDGFTIPKPDILCNVAASASNRRICDFQTLWSFRRHNKAQTQERHLPCVRTSQSGFNGSLSGHPVWAVSGRHSAADLAGCGGGVGVHPH